MEGAKKKSTTWIKIWAGEEVLEHNACIRGKHYELLRFVVEIAQVCNVTGLKISVL